jgi:septal ring factor EnvC (AmiA/AmiB activator)|tara:strand:- start:1168 stop:1623 length:456 start_codon:yes stop_codon:yes gene_type:complete
MAEIEIGGVKFKGGRMVAIAMALSSAVGVLYGGFEVYKDYMDMKEQIQEYVAPDLSAINQSIAVLEETVESQNTIIEAYETKIGSMQTNQDVMRESINRIDGDQDSLTNDIRDSDKRLYELERDTGKELIDIRKQITEQIEIALENPLAGQ